MRDEDPWACLARDVLGPSPLLCRLTGEVPAELEARYERAWREAVVSGGERWLRVEADRDVG